MGQLGVNYNGCYVVVIVVRVVAAAVVFIVVVVFVVFVVLVVLVVPFCCCYCCYSLVSLQVSSMCILRGPWIVYKRAKDARWVNYFGEITDYSIKHLSRSADMHSSTEISKSLFEFSNPENKMILLHNVVSLCGMLSCSRCVCWDIL